MSVRRKAEYLPRLTNTDRREAGKASVAFLGDSKVIPKPTVGDFVSVCLVGVRPGHAAPRSVSRSSLSVTVGSTSGGNGREPRGSFRS
jgi:hypothetical protein